ncbi:hypothetical protein [Dactylosporangium darangshiense]|uniref:Uncharacterized protein n=1 Tax=Dactylosporangium darangshiense TaxID=579108 RepID=A0ABP8DB59_9ACTN
MFLVTVAIERTAQAVVPVLEPDLVVKALRAGAAPDDGLEHVSARAGPGGLQVGLFCRALDREIAETNAHRICRNVFKSQPPFTGWRLAEGNS